MAVEPPDPDEFPPGEAEALLAALPVVG